MILTILLAKFITQINLLDHLYSPRGEPIGEFALLRFAETRGSEETDRGETIGEFALLRFAETRGSEETDRGESGKFKFGGTRGSEETDRGEFIIGESDCIKKLVNVNKL
jgi:hypothetical protein